MNLYVVSVYCDTDIEDEEYFILYFVGENPPTDALIRNKAVVHPYGDNYSHYAVKLVPVHRC